MTDRMRTDYTNTQEAKHTIHTISRKETKKERERHKDYMQITKRRRLNLPEDGHLKHLERGIDSQMTEDREK